MADDPPRRLTVSSLGCVLFVFGLVFAGFGTLFVVQLLRDPQSVTVNHRKGRRSDAWMPGIFVAFGLGLAGIRNRRIVDFDARTIETRRGWGPFVSVARDDLGEWRAVEIAPEESRGSGSGRYTAVPVRLVGATATREIAAPRSSEKARALAATIARGAGIALRDASAGAVVERDAARLDEPLVPRLREADLAAPEPTPNRLRVDEGVRGVRVRVPASRAVGCAFPFALLPLAMFGLFWWFAWRPGLIDDPKAPRLFVYAPLLMGALPALLALVSALRRGSFGYLIEADESDGLRALGKRFGRDELTGLDVVEVGMQRWLRATSATREAKLGAGLSRAELEWLRATLLRALRG